MIRIEGIPVVAARLAEALKSTKATEALQGVHQRRTRLKSRNRRPRTKAQACV